MSKIGLSVVPVCNCSYRFSSSCIYKHCVYCSREHPRLCLFTSICSAFDSALHHLSSSVPQMNGRLPSAFLLWVWEFIQCQCRPYCLESVQWRHMSMRPARLHRKEIRSQQKHRRHSLLLSNIFIILLAPPIQEWPDKSAAQ